MKVFDNLYFVGQSEYSAWAVTTTEGIILIDTLFDYSVEDAVVGGLKTLGLDPATIRYAVVTHPHPDHHGGAKHLQDRGARVIMACRSVDKAKAAVETLASAGRHGIVEQPEALAAMITAFLAANAGAGKGEG